MKLRIEIWSRDVTGCPDCGGERVVYTGEVGTKRSTTAVFGASLYDHPGNPEVYIDATFGTFGVDDPAADADHVTFGSRTGYMDEHPHFACTLVTGGAMAPDEPFFGAKLTRDQALTHPWLKEFWMVNDIILEGIDEVARLFDAG